MCFVTKGYIVKVSAIVLDGDYTLRKVIRDVFLVNNRIRNLDIECVIYVSRYKRGA
jgi:hypothetical protein